MELIKEIKDNKKFIKYIVKDFLLNLMLIGYVRSHQRDVVDLLVAVWVGPWSQDTSQTIVHPIFDIYSYANLF